MTNIPFNIDNSSIDTLVCSGAGYNLIYEFGICSELQKRFNFNTIYGTSAGSIVGLAMAVGWNLDELLNILVIKINGKKVYSGYLLVGVLRFLFKDYLFNNDIRYLVLETILSKVNNQDLTFSELASLTSIDLNIIATEISTGATIVFNKDNTPTVSVKSAALASSSLPIAFKPISFSKSSVNNFIEGFDPVSAIPNSFQCIDGGYSSFYPINFIPLDKVNNGLGVCMVVRYPVDPNASILSHLRNYLLNFSHPASSLPSQWSQRTLFFLMADPLTNYLKTFHTDKVKQQIAKAKRFAQQFLTNFGG